MPGVLKVCRAAGCARLIPDHGFCAEHQRADNRRRAAKQQRHGRNTSAWKRIRRVVLERDGHRCTVCGTTENLSVHLDPAYGTFHVGPPLEAFRTLCLRHHGAADAARSSRGSL